MRTVKIIFAIVFILRISSLFASNDGSPAKENNEMNVSRVLLMGPTTPKEATFEETGYVPQILTLAPVTPKEAFFEDEAGDLNITSLAPVTPAEADFTDIP